MNLLSKVLDLRSENQEVISSNIANAETPGYSPARFEFENQLRQAMNRDGFHLVTDNPRHMPAATTNLDSISGTVVRIHDKTGIGDKNGVDVNQEMVSLSKNEIMYEANATILSKKLSLLTYVIDGG